VARGRDMQNAFNVTAPCVAGGEFVFSNLSYSLTALGEIDEALEMARRAYPAVERQVV